MEMNPRSRTGTELPLCVSWNDYLGKGHERYVRPVALSVPKVPCPITDIIYTVQESSPRLQSPPRTLTHSHSKGVYSSNILPKTNEPAISYSEEADTDTLPSPDFCYP
jgi:hypothetical protein